MLAFTLLQVTALLIIVATLIGVAIGRWPWLRMNRATIALTGGVLRQAIDCRGTQHAHCAGTYRMIPLITCR